MTTRRARRRGSLALAVLLASVGLGSQGPEPEREAQGHANRGIALLEQFRFAEAARELERVVALRPDAATGWVNLGIAYFHLRDFDRALEAFEKARALAPESPYVHYNLGLIYKLQGRTEEAAAAFEKVARIDPEDAMTHYYLGTLYGNLGRLDEAVRELERAIEIQPNNESAHFSLGNILIRQGKVDEGRRELEIFRRLKESFPAEAASAGLQYTELGKYAEAIEEAAPPLQPPLEERLVDSAVRWVEATAEAGLAVEPLAPIAAPTETVRRATLLEPGGVERFLLGRFGPGLALRDVDGDEDADLLVLRGGAVELYRNEGGRFTPAAAGLPAEGRFVGLTVGDVDGDGDADVYLVGAGPNALYRNDGTGSFERVADAGVEGDDVSLAASFADVDHDGDLDLYVCNYLDAERLREGGPDDELVVPDDLPGAPNRLYRNDGDGTFTEIGAESRTAGRERSVGVLFSDLDDDRDIDFVVVNDGEAARAYSNDRVGTFTDKARAWGVEIRGRARGIDSGDFDRDGSFDLLVAFEGATLNGLFRGPASRGLRPDVRSPGLLAAGAPGARFGVAFADADNDADLDVLLVANEPGALVAYYESTAEGFRRAGSLAPADGRARQGRGLAVADIDLDGDVDAVVVTDRGEPLVFRNDGGNAGGWLRIRARGLRSNKDGLGTKIEVKAGDARLRREVRAVAGFLSHSELPLHFGLGPHRAADYVRLLWPGGVKQIEMDVAGGATVTIEELNRKGTSCPILYTWDGEAMRFVTDFLGGSAIGYLLAPGVYNVPDTDEYVKLEQFEPVPRDGFYELRWVNQLEEVLMYDKASLVVVDHPEDVEVFPNERLMPGPPYPPARLYAVRDRRPPVRAVDDRGVDVTELVRQRDRLYPAGFAKLPFKGYAELHALTLELPPVEPGEHWVLLLYGWVDYADSSSNLAAAQAGVRLVTPYLEVGDASGSFRMGLEQMGFPAGLPKTMLVDLGGVLTPSSRYVRITTSMRLYWDEIAFARVVPEAPLRVHELAPAAADLHFLGYPAPYLPEGRHPVAYDYGRIESEELWDAHEGDYTRYGDVRELVLDVDDRYVITRHGDELALRFDARGLEPLAPGWSRTVLVYADGFGKDMDLNSARPDTVEPLPFHGMSAYPYPPEEGYPSTEAHRRYRATYNTRRVERRRWFGTPTTP